MAKFSHHRRTTEVVKANLENLLLPTRTYNKCEITLLAPTRASVGWDHQRHQPSSTITSRVSRPVQCLAIWVLWATTSLSHKTRCLSILTTTRIACLAACQMTLRRVWMTSCWSSRKWSMRHRVVRRASRPCDLRCLRRPRPRVLATSCFPQMSTLRRSRAIFTCIRATRLAVKGKNRCIRVGIWLLKALSSKVSRCLGADNENDS